MLCRRSDDEDLHVLGLNVFVQRLFVQFQRTFEGSDGALRVFHPALELIDAGYAKLNVLCDNYEEYLSRSISDVLDKSIRVRLIHDATAVGLYFSDCPKSVCLTLGTFIGVGFTDII